MSLHELTKELIDPIRGEWRGVCSCGWKGQTVIEAQLVKDSYRLHMEAALGADAYYPAPAGCVNCGYEGDANFLIGTSVWSGTCPRCGVSGRLRPDNDVYKRDKVVDE